MLIKDLLFKAVKDTKSKAYDDLYISWEQKGRDNFQA